MIDAYQMTVIAYQTEGGEMIHLECAPIRGTSEDWRENDKVMEEHGFLPLSRYTIHEYARGLWEDLSWRADFPIELNTDTSWGEDADIDYTTGEERIKDDLGEWHDISDIVGEHCAHCNKRIT